LAGKAQCGRNWWTRKLCYMGTCEYCVSHYLAAGAVVLTDYWLLIPDSRGYLLAWLSVVAVANVYLSAYGRLRVEMRKERAVARHVETNVKKAG